MTWKCGSSGTSSRSPRNCTSGAAGRLGMAQPPLSRAIRDLERQLGVVLLERTTRQVRLTTAGAGGRRAPGTRPCQQRSTATGMEISRRQWTSMDG